MTTLDTLVRGLDQVPIPEKICRLGDVLDEHEREHAGSDIPTIWFQKCQPHYPTYWGELHDYRVGLQHQFYDLPIEQSQPHHLDIAKRTYAAARDRLAMLRSLDPCFYTQREMIDAVQAEAFAEFVYRTLVMYQEWEAQAECEIEAAAAKLRPKRRGRKLPPQFRN
jgi:hypothetical protein